MVFKDERRTVRPWDADGPPANFKVVPETMFVSGGVEHITADGPPLGRGRSADYLTICTRDIVVSGGFQGRTEDGPLLGHGRSAG